MPQLPHPGDVLDEEQVQVARKEDVLNSLSQIAGKYRTRVGELLATVEKHNTPLAEAATPSLEAFKAYSTGWKILSSTGPAAALPTCNRNRLRVCDGTRYAGTRLWGYGKNNLLC